MAEHSTDAERAKEYGQFVAVLPISIGGHLAFAPGDPVPASTVKANPEWLKPTDLGDVPLVGETAVTYNPLEGPPPKSARKADWEAFARFSGASDEDIDGKTRDELVAAYGAE